MIHSITPKRVIIQISIFIIVLRVVLLSVVILIVVAPFLQESEINLF
jgi:hypothetical protein